MAISDNYVPIKQIGNGSTVDFSGGWNVLAAAYIRVYLESVATGVQVPQSLGSDFTLAFSPSGFTVTFLVAPTNANYVVIGREVALDQTDPYKTSKGFQGEVIEASFDKVTAITQDLRDVSSRSLQYRLGTATTTSFIDEPVDGAVLQFDGVTGKVKAGPLITDIAALAAIIPEIIIVADDIASVIAVADDIASVNTVAGAITAVNTVAGAIASVETNATNIAAITTNATNIAAILDASNNANIAKAAAGFSYVYSTNTAASDPGTGVLKFNDATLGSATALYISETTQMAQAISAEIATWDDSTSVIHGKLRMFQQADPSIFALFNVTGTITDNGTWDTITVSYVGGSGSFANNDVVTIQYLRTGDKGDTGATGPTGAGITPATSGTAGYADFAEATANGSNYVRLKAADSLSGNFTVALPSRNGTIATKEGTATNDNAAAGEIGEILEVTVLLGAAVAVTSGNSVNVASISATGGDWDASGVVCTAPGSGTLQTGIAGWISTASATFPTLPNSGAIFFVQNNFPASTGQNFGLSEKRISLPSTTTVYLSAFSAHTVSTNAAYGYMMLRRRR